MAYPESCLISQLVLQQTELKSENKYFTTGKSIGKQRERWEQMEI